MKKMCRIISGLFVVAGMLAYGGCSKFLDKQPAGVEASTNFFQTEDQANRALIAAYGAIAWQYSADGGNWFNQWMIGDIVSDDAQKGGEGPADIADLEQLRRFQANPQNSIIAPQWQVPYIGIYRANLVIDNVPNIDMDTTLRSRFVAEAKFLRAWSYFILVKSFGDVPLVLHRLAAGEYCQARTPKAQVWAQIETDLSEAADVLPLKSEYDASVDAGRATKGAAQALLVKAYVYQGKFADAEPLAKEIIDGAEYDLEPNFSDNFDPNNENGLESIFELQYLIDPADSWTNTNQGQIFSVFQGDRSDPYFPGWGFDCPTQSLVNEFEPGDKRKAATVYTVGDIIYANTPAADTIKTMSSPTGYMSRKYLLGYQPDEVPDMANAPNNWRAIRYSDVLLFYAEALNENGKAAEARTELNKVRARAGLTGVPAGLSKDSLKTLIFHERRVEFACEGQRFWDVVRQGRGAAVFGSMGFQANRNEVFAIPQVEIDVCPSIIQNPNYH
jgi:starch-binding outer membrane protein, SusD/RagB family